MSTEIVGFAATLVSLVLWWPQTARVWKYRNDPGELVGISRLGQVLLIGSGVIWTTYAVLTDSLWLGVSVSTNIPLGVITLAILSQARWVACPGEIVAAGAVAAGAVTAGAVTAGAVTAGAVTAGAPAPA